ncbi:hypothetical protein MUK42_35828 [Musa troglodytarum]|uniref:Uncharacterized protein n=1 Tax=Musa troglodytarum TaxID=320322 RepID=A0A9E7ECZ6_9LILI|nr:hypothetical protein MUK42_35828 [Musa troglodytarum]
MECSFLLGGFLYLGIIYVKYCILNFSPSPYRGAYVVFQQIINESLDFSKFYQFDCPASLHSLFDSMSQ